MVLDGYRDCLLREVWKVEERLIFTLDHLCRRHMGIARNRTCRVDSEVLSVWGGDGRLSTIVTVGQMAAYSMS